MFDLFRQSNSNASLPDSNSFRMSDSQTSIRANAIFPDPKRDDTHVDGDNQNNKNNNSGSNGFSIFQTFGNAFSDSQVKEQEAALFDFDDSKTLSTNLQPENRGIAQQRSLLDEMERHGNDDRIVSDTVLQGLSRQMEAMTVEEQERAMYDLMTENELTLKMEDKQTPHQWMAQMDECMERKKSTHGGALQLAMNTNMQYVKDQRWKFLRAEDWHVEWACERMARFFEHKLDLFGSEALCRELTMDDLTDEDKAELTTRMVAHANTENESGLVAFSAEVVAKELGLLE